MIMRKADRKRKKNISRTAASKKFSRYKKEEEKMVKRFEATKNEVVEQLKGLWGACRYSVGYDDAFHDMVLNLLRDKGPEYSSEDVEMFSIVLAELQDEKLFSHKGGLFLSALVNNGKDSNYVIHTAQLELINYLGFKNIKNLVIKGDVHGWAGGLMEAGSIVVEGKAGNLIGFRGKGGTITVEEDVGDGTGQWLKGGTIIVNGNAGGWVGKDMEGGTIIVKGSVTPLLGPVGNEMAGGKIRIRGNTGEGVGHRMEGGEIHLEGDYEDISDKIKGGKIYHKGKLIVDE